VVLYIASAGNETRGQPIWILWTIYEKLAQIIKFIMNFMDYKSIVRPPLPPGPLTDDDVYYLNLEHTGHSINQVCFVLTGVRYFPKLVSN
jgi:hypothetical protein